MGVSKMDSKQAPLLPNNPTPNISSTQPAPATAASNPVAQPAPASAPVATPTTGPVTVTKVSFWLKPILKRPIIMWMLVVYLVLLAIVNVFKLADGTKNSTFLTSWGDQTLLSYFYAEMVMYGLSVAVFLTAAVIIWLKKKWGLWILLGAAGAKLVYTLIIWLMFNGKLMIEGSDFIVPGLVMGIIGMLIYAVLAALLAFHPACKQVFTSKPAAPPQS